jgi:hypothetical protein
MTVQSTCLLCMKDFQSEVTWVKDESEPGGGYNASTPCPHCDGFHFTCKVPVGRTQWYGTGGTTEDAS